jgi:hypothetical protein
MSADTFVRTHLNETAGIAATIDAAAPPSTPRKNGRPRTAVSVAIIRSTAAAWESLP